MSKIEKHELIPTLMELYPDKVLELQYDARTGDMTIELRSPITDEEKQALADRKS
jgi:hypothetical protein